MNDLPLEKQLIHRQFCDQVAGVSDRNVLIEMLKQLHLNYLGQKAMFVKIAKNEFLGDRKL